MTTNRKAISDEERNRRLKAVKYAEASVGLSGFRIPPEEQAQAMRYVNGEIDLDEYMRMPHPIDTRRS